MFNIFKEVRVLQEEGKLHKKLISQVRILFLISFVLAGVTAYNLVFRGVDARFALALAGIGFILGLYVFSRMSAVNWNEQEKVVQLGRMDMVGYATIGLYIVFEIGLRTFLHDFFPISATAFLLAGIFGTLFGRAIGVVIEIHRVFRATRSG